MITSFTPTFAEKISFGKTDKVMVYYGKNGLGDDFFCYIRCGLAGYAKMKNDYLTETSAYPEDYGEILYQDFISEPDEKAKEFLKKFLAENNGTLNQ